MKVTTFYGNQARTFSVLIKDPFVMLCEFEENGSWCYWILDSTVDGGWRLGENSRGDGQGRNCPAAPNFRPVLNRVYEELIKDLASDIILGVDNE